MVKPSEIEGECRQIQGNARVTANVYNLQNKLDFLQRM